jgi:hypothetical protein
MNTRRIPDRIGWYIAGFVDGEGSFNVSLRKKSDYRVGWQPILSFNVSQRERTVLALMKRHLVCGIIKQRKDGLYSYDVTNPHAIETIIIPFFEKYLFLSATKKRNFSLFKKIVRLMATKRHLTPEGFYELLRLREKINQGKGRTRKYSMQFVLESSETIRQARRKVG